MRLTTRTRLPHVARPKRRWLRTACGVLMAIASAAPARADDGAAGTWEGHYTCGQGDTAVSLSVWPGRGDDVTALFHFSALPSNPEVPEGCFEMSGRFDPQTRTLRLTPGRWLMRPQGYVTVDVTAELSADGGSIHGAIVAPGCGGIEARRVPGPLESPAVCRGPLNVVSTLR